MNSNSIAEAIMHWLKEQLKKMGLSNEGLDNIEPILYILIIAIAAFAIAEIVYRVTKFILWRIQKMREYTFLTKIVEHKVLRKQTNVLDRKSVV